jgi:hypothetical protein
MEEKEKKKKVVKRTNFIFLKKKIFDGFETP